MFEIQYFSDFMASRGRDGWTAYYVGPRRFFDTFQAAEQHIARELKGRQQWDRDTFRVIEVEA